MTSDEIAPFIEKNVTVTVRDGFTYSGTLVDTPEEGLYHVLPGAVRPGVIERYGPLADIWGHEILRIEASR